MIKLRNRKFEMVHEMTLGRKIPTEMVYDIVGTIVNLRLRLEQHKQMIVDTLRETTKP